MATHALSSSLLLCAALASGCYRTTVSSVSRESSRKEQRVPVNSDARLVASTWREEPGAIIGQLQIQTCDTSRTWTSSRIRTTKREPSLLIPAVSYGLAGAAAIAAVGLYNRRIDP